MRIVLLNPNTSATATADMVAIVREELAALGVVAQVLGMTAPRGPSLIDNPKRLASAADVVAGMAETVAVERPDAVVLSAFGDPGVAALRAALPVPVAALAESALAEAGTLGAFAIVTSTPALGGHLEDLVVAAGVADRYVGIVYTEGEIAPLLADPARLSEAIAVACREASSRWGVDAVVIGGGPLARAGGGVRVPGVTVVDPVRAAVRRVVRALEAAS